MSGRAPVPFTGLLTPRSTPDHPGTLPSGEAGPRFERAFAEIDAAIDWFRYRLRRNRDPGQYHIQPYLGHGSSSVIHVSGRVFEGSPVPAANANDSRFRNLQNILRRFAADEVPAARIRVRSGDVVETLLANDEGFFEALLPVDTPAQHAEVWRDVTLELLDPQPTDGAVRAIGRAIVPPDTARFGIISDIDDTIVPTDVANLLRMLRLILLTNAHTRLPFAGVAAFYRQLHAGSAGPSTNPIFYVSSSPWNFYDLLTEVFEVHGIPVGPLLLKDFGLARDLLLSRGHAEHKLAAIERILSTHPLPFLLIGDSGQHDPEIYREIVRRHPDRVLAIYIRDVSVAMRDVEIDSIAADLAGVRVEMVRVPDTLAAAEHAAANGFIDPAGLAEIRQGRVQDLTAPGPLSFPSDDER